MFFGKDKEANYYVNLALHHLSSLFRISDAKYAERDAGTTLPLRVRSSSSQAHMRRLSQAARATPGKGKKKAKGKASRVAPRRSTHDAPLTRGDIASQVCVCVRVCVCECVLVGMHVYTGLCPTVRLRVHVCHPLPTRRRFRR